MKFYCSTLYSFLIVTPPNCLLIFHCRLPFCKCIFASHEIWKQNTKLPITVFHTIFSKTNYQNSIKTLGNSQHFVRETVLKSCSLSFHLVRHFLFCFGLHVPGCTGARWFTSIFRNMIRAGCIVMSRTDRFISL